MQQMVDALLVRIPENTRRSNVRVESVQPENGKWLVASAGRTDEFDAAIIATPAYAAAELLNSNIALADELNTIRYSSSVTVVLGYDEHVRAALLPGFGFLVPRTEGRRILAATFVHNKFPDRAPPDHALIRCFLGGARDELALTTSDDEILSVVRTELQQTLGISAAPLFARVNRWPRSMAQYGIGHAARVSRIREHLATMPGLALAGNAYSGIGVPDCIRSGSEAAEKVLIDLSSNK